MSHPFVLKSRNHRKKVIRKREHHDIFFDDAGLHFSLNKQSLVVGPAARKKKVLERNKRVSE